jgi:hypothetical protein
MDDQQIVMRADSTDIDESIDLFSLVKDLDKDEPPPSEKEIAPLALFLASSLNVELVYIILKGITQFGYVTSSDAGHCEITDKRISKMSLENVAGNCTLTLNEIKLKDYKKWQPENECDLIDAGKDTHMNSRET